VLYDRKFDPESEEPHPHESEMWIVEFLVALFSGDDKMPVFFPTDPIPSTSNKAHLLGCAKYGKKLATWKEIVCFRDRRLLHIYNLTSHGRRMYRTLVFSSNSSFCLHSFPPNTAPRKKGLPAELRLAVGSSKQLRSIDRTLIITRKNERVEGVETYVPPRLLQGLIPGALLEAFRFWEGADGIIRGEPLDPTNLWFNYNVEVKLAQDGTDWHATLTRRPQGVGHRRIKGTQARLAGTGAVDAHERANSKKVTIVDEELISQLSAMGFGASVAKLALKKNNLDLQSAAQWLFDDGNAEEVLMYESKVELMVQEGYSRALAEHALDTFDGNQEVAQAWLCDSDNLVELTRLEALYSGEGDAAQMEVEKTEVTTPGVEGSGDRSESPLDVSEGPVEAVDKRKKDLVLLNTLEASSGGLLHRMATLMSRLEDLSHVLVWASTGPSDEASMDTGLLSIDLIELPRLKLTMKPKCDEDGQVRLYLLDHSGWFVSDLYSVAEVKESKDSTAMDVTEDREAMGRKLLKSLLGGLEHSILLSNHTDEFQVLVANHDVYRPKVKGEPFSTQVIFDRASLGWQQSMEQRYYLYPIHTSWTFLNPPTLSATLYLILLRVLHRNYASAFERIESCSVDVPFTNEEQWIWSQFERTMEDFHPDAHACRLKLCLAVQYCRDTNKVAWENHLEMDRYLAKLRHVSAACRLSYLEELDVLHLCKQGTPLIKNRLAYLKAARDSGIDVKLATESPRWGGQPWLKLNLQTLDYITQNGTKLSRVHYRPPANLANEAFFELLWSENLLMDEESGANRQLGYLFLYELATGRITATVDGVNVGSDLADILSRYFHLKLSRWGREQVDRGEVECSNSTHMAHLALVLSNRRLPWPVIPSDNRSKVSMEHGLNLFTPEGRNSNVKAWFDLMDLQFVTTMGSDVQATRMAVIREAVDRLRSQPLKVEISVQIEPEDGLRASGELKILSDQPEFPVASDTSCVLVRIHPTIGLTPEGLQHLATRPLGVLGLDKYISWEANDEKVADDLVFDVSTHPSARTVVARDMLERLRQDVAGFAATTNNSKVPRVVYLSKNQIEAFKMAPVSGEQLQPLFAVLNELTTALHELRRADREFVGVAMARAVQGTDEVEGVAVEPRACVFWLQRFSDLRNHISMDFLTQCLMSSRAIEDIKAINPFAGNIPEALNLVATILLHVNRIAHANRALGAVRQLEKGLRGLTASNLENKNLEMVIDHIIQASDALAEALVTERHYAVFKNGAVELDPRFLVFEYIFDLSLRRRQVEMVNWFVSSLRENQSRVQQMIMGAGKTTVVGPLLTLILADGKQLVTQVMPTALLDQTRGIMRSRFSVIIRKRVFTLEFERSVEDDVEIVGEILAKLENARRRRSVVCASPEAIKSLMLKFVEHLHAIEKLDLGDLSFGSSARQNREIGKLRDSMLAKSDMADMLVRVLDLWKGGVLIMDEVDVLLHPLRSELNFPIGHKDPVDLSGYRWDLPIFLVDGIFYSQAGYRLSERIKDQANAPARAGVADIHQLLQDIALVVEDGYNQHALQRSPHLVLLDNRFYDISVRPLIARWALVWLHDHFTGRVGVSNEILLAYLNGEIEANREAVETGLTAQSKKLLNLAREWVCTLQPHCLSKVDRVSYGILNPVDLAALNPRAPLSRRLMAVPFIGKDVPSTSSEFAHVDVVIGLTVMAYRYEGLRLSDLHRLITQLKADYSRQGGPRASRPASLFFQSWLMEVAAQKKVPGMSGEDDEEIADMVAMDTSGVVESKESETNGNSPSRTKAATRPGLPVSPLPLFQPNDPKQLVGTQR